MKKLMLLAFICMSAQLSASSYPFTPQSPLYSSKALSPGQFEVNVIDLFFNALEASAHEFSREFLKLKYHIAASPYNLDIDKILIKDEQDEECTLGTYLDSYEAQPDESFKQTNALILAAYFSSQRSTVKQDKHALLRNLLDSAMIRATSCEEVKRFAQSCYYDIKAIGLISDEDTDTLFDWLSSESVREPIAQQLIDCFIREEQSPQTPIVGSRVHDTFVRDLNKTLAHPVLFDDFVHQHGDEMKNADMIEFFPDQMVGPLLHRSTVKKVAIVSKLITLTEKQRTISLKPLDAFCQLVRDTVYASKQAFTKKLAQLKATCQKEEYNVDRILYDLAPDENQSDERVCFRSLGGWLDSLLRDQECTKKVQLCAVLCVVHPYRKYKGEAPLLFLEALMKNHIEDESATLDDVATCFNAGTYDIDTIHIHNQDLRVDDSFSEMLQEQLLNDDESAAMRALSILQLAQAQRSDKDAVLLFLVENICQGTDLTELLNRWLHWYPSYSPETVEVEHNDRKMTLKDFLLESKRQDVLEVIDMRSRTDASPNQIELSVYSQTPLRRSPRGTRPHATRKKLFKSPHPFAPSPLAQGQTPYRRRTAHTQGSYSSESSSSTTPASHVSPASPRYQRQKWSVLAGVVRSPLGSMSLKGSTGSSEDSSDSSPKKPQKSFLTPRTVLIAGAGLVFAYTAYARYRNASSHVGHASDKEHATVVV